MNNNNGVGDYTQFCIKSRTTTITDAIVANSWLHLIAYPHLIASLRSGGCGFRPIGGASSDLHHVTATPPIDCRRQPLFNNNSPLQMAQMYTIKNNNSPSRASTLDRRTVRFHDNPDNDFRRMYGDPNVGMPTMFPPGVESPDFPPPLPLWGADDLFTDAILVGYIDSLIFETFKDALWELTNSTRAYFKLMLLYIYFKGKTNWNETILGLN